MNDLMTRRFMGYVLAAASLFSPLALHSQQRPPTTLGLLHGSPRAGPGQLA